MRKGGEKEGERGRDTEGKGGGTCGRKQYENEGK
jgi:hypothetical protein